MAEHEAPFTGDRIVNRGDAEPKPHEQYLESNLKTDRAESLWDRTVERPAGSRPTDSEERARELDAGALEAKLFQEGDLIDMRRRWSDIQASFVDEPRRAVQQADSLVQEATQRLTQTFTSARERLEQQWARGDNGVTTEDLRVALQRYRSFFDRLLSM
jgi:hypothetical protein